MSTIRLASSPWDLAVSAAASAIADSVRLKRVNNAGSAVVAATEAEAPSNNLSLSNNDLREQDACNTARFSLQMTGHGGVTH